MTDEQDPPPVPGVRSAEERRRGHLEREAHRAGLPGEDLQLAERPAPARGPRPTRRRVWARRAAALASLLVSGAAVWFVLSLLQPFTGRGSGSVTVAIPSGAGVGEIGDILDRRGVVSSSFFFGLRARLDGDSGDLKPGVYHLRHGMSYTAALDALTKGVAPNVIQITLPEGLGRRQIAPRVRSAGLRGSYLAATVRSPSLDPRHYGARHARNLEGFLFPASFQLKRGAEVRALVKAQLRAFRQNFSKVSLRYARSRHLSPYDLLVIASMVEREAQVARDRPLIASVIYNRLHAQMDLGIDATLRYALNDWSKPLRVSQLRSRTPYNTGNHPGLPPGPIGNPGLASMRAAAHPARTRYLYYVVKPCGNGEHVFARTEAQFNRDVARYNAARAKKGGRSPESCR